MRLIPITLIFFTALSQSFSFAQSSTCTNAYLETVDSICSTTVHNIDENQNQYWIQFTATSENISLITTLSGVSPILSAVHLVSGDCINNQIIETDSTFNIGDTLSFSSNLIIGQNYFIRFEIASAFKSKFEACVVKNTYTMFLYITNENGDTIYICSGTHFPLAGQGPGGWHCDPLDVCIEDSLCLNFELFNSFQSLDDTTFFIQQITNLAINGQINSDSTEYCVSFLETGLVTFFIHPEYPNFFNPFPPEHSNNSNYYFSFNVLDQTPPATTNSNGILCVGDTYTIDGYPGSTITSVTIDNQITYTPNSNSWSTILYTAGQHTIQYTVDGFCHPVTYFDTVQVIDSTFFTMTMDACNQATFTFTTCELFPQIELIYGDGTSELIGSFTGTITWTHDYSNISSAVTWVFNGTQQIQLSPPVFGITYSQSGIIQPVTPQSIQITAPQYLCEMDTNTIFITSPSGLQNIVWAISPANSFTGQGTYTITPNSWSPFASDIVVYVTATDTNGCIYEDSVIILSCCQQDTSGTEFFERGYTVMGPNSMNMQLPNGYYNGPTQQISINLSAPPSTTNQISTSYSSSTSITQLIANNPSIYNGTAISTTNWLFINNDLIIDQNILFDLCHFVRFAPGAKMIVQPGITLSIQRSTLAPHCEEMWGGIELTDNTQTVNLNDVSLVAAENGISTSNGGLYMVNNSRFIDCLYGISVQNYLSAPTLSTVVNSYFGDVTSQPLLTPYQTEPQPLAGILIKNIQSIEIGTTSTARGNLFHNHQRGISASASTVKSYKNNFYNIRHSPSVPMLNEGDKFAAIYAVNAVVIPAGLLNHTLEVGGNTAIRNNFVNCEFGVSSKNGMNLDARFNYMKNCALRGISAEDNRLKTINIYNNQINSTNSNAWGIYVKNYSNGIANIYNNEINTSPNNQSGITRFAAGIYVSSVTPTVFQTTSVLNNTIKNCLYGIWMINTAGGLIESNTIDINMNNLTINNLSNNFAPIRGIVVQNSPKAKIKSNVITRNMGPGNGVVNNNLQGIRLELSPAAEVWSNKMYNTAVGFYAYGTSLGSRIDCNQMHFTRNGFYLEDADLSDQGAPENVSPYLSGYSAHNAWINTFEDRTAGTMSNNPNRYYHADSPNLFSNPASNLTSQWLDLNLLSSTPYNTCVQAIPPQIVETPISKRTRELLPIVQNSIQYDTLDYQQKHYLKLSSYSRLENDSNLLIMNVPDDSIYISYLQENIILNSQSKIIYDVQRAMAQNDFNVALNTCNQISTSCDQFNTNKIVQELWLDRKSNDLEFTSADTMLLMNIACLDPIEFGSGVYQARAMIDWDGFCFNQNKSSDNGKIEIEKIVLESKVFPNPSEGKIKIESSLLIEKVIILDLKGAELSNFTINENYEIDSQLSTGVYLLKIILENGSIETHKIYIK